MEEQREIETGRFLWVAALTIVISVLAVMAVRAAAVHWLHPGPRFQPLGVAAPVVDTVICVLVTIFVFASIVSSPRDVRRWRSVATVVLMVTFIPDVALGLSHSMDATWPEACALMAMHVAVWAVCITLLPGLAFSRPSEDEKRDGDSLSIL